MKILIGNVLFTIAICINWREINSTGGTYGHGSPSQAHNTDTIIKMIHFKGHPIEVAGTMKGHYFIPFRCTLILEGRHPIIPDLEYRRLNFYLVRDATENNIRCVAYVLGDGVVLGVKAPPTTPPPPDRIGDPAYLNPTATKWYLSYMNHDYVVKMNDNSVVYDVALYPEDKLRKGKVNKAEVVGGFPINWGALNIYVYQKIDGEVVGAKYILPKTGKKIS